MGTSGNRDCHWAFRSVLKDFTEDALTISAGSFFQNGTIRMVGAHWGRLLVKLVSVAAKPFAGWMFEGALHGEFQKTMGNLEHGC